MSLSILFSGDTAGLAGRLAEDMSRPVPGADPLIPTRILVPNRNLEKWLRFDLAARNRVAANLEFPYLERGLWNLTCEIGVARGVLDADATGRAAVREMDGPTVRARIAAILMRDADDPVRADSVLLQYCRAGGDSSDAGFAMRLWQVSGRLAELFLEYEFSRTAMVRDWNNGVVDERMGRIGAEQARIYHEACGSGWSADAAGTTRMSLFQLAEKVFPSGSGGSHRGTAAAGGCPVFIFGMSSMSPYHCRLIYEISRFRDIRMYHMNVCREFWEDVSTPREDRWRRIRNTGLDGDGELDLATFADDNPLLKAWGKAGRETVKLLADLDDQSGGVDVTWLDDGDDEEPSPDWSVLERVRHGIRRRTTASGRAAQDGSITITACPGPEREVEDVYERLVDLFSRDPGIRLSDVAVLVPDMAAYKPVVSAVFERDAFPVPYNLADSTADIDSQYAGAVSAMLALVDSDFSRRAVFELLFNPCFIAAAGIDAGEVGLWLRWAAELGIYHDMRGQSGGGDGGNPFTWDGALRRIRFGRIMEPYQDPGVRHPGAAAGLFADAFPYVDAETGGGAADRFCSTIERLWLALSPLRALRCGPAEWGNRLSSLFDEFLAIPDDRQGEWSVRRALFDGMAANLADDSGLGAAMREAGAPGELAAPFVFEILRGLLSGISTGRGAYMTNGVTVASLKPMRPIPFKVVFVLGLQEGAFPGTGRESSLDLRAGRREIGDVTTPDAGRYMFLETLLCAGSALHLSYDAWDAVRDRRYEPCSIVRQLEKFISESILPEHDGRPAPFRRDDVPLSPHGARYLDAAAAPPGRARRMKDRVVAGMLEATESGRIPELAAALRSALDDAVARGLDGTRDCADIRTAIAAMTGAEPRADEAGPGDQAGNAVEGTTSDETAPGGEIGNAVEGAASDGTVPAVRGRVRVTIRELCRFLENPFDARLRRFFRLYPEKESGEEAFREDEPFAWAEWDDWRIREQWLYDVVASGGDTTLASDLLRRRGVSAHAKSTAPAGIFRTAPEDDLIDRVLESYGAVAGSFPHREFLERAVIGDDLPPDFAPGLALPAVVIDIPAVGRRPAATVEVVGSVDFVASGGADGPPEYMVASAAWNKGRFPARLFGPVLFGLAGGLASGRDAIDFVASQFYGGGVARVAVSMTRDAAAGYLAGVIADYLDDERLYECMPFRLVQTVMSGSGENDETPLDPAEIVEGMRLAMLAGFDGDSREYHPSRLELLMSGYARVPDDLCGIVARRLEPLMNLPDLPLTGADRVTATRGAR